MTTDTLHVPEGINYSCSGCGRCCYGVAVPMTAEDYQRVSNLEWPEDSEFHGGKNLFRPLKPHERAGTAYTDAIKPDYDGHCPFLVDKLCAIHGKFGAEAKPIICRLFPYCFNETPSGTFVTVSFRSNAVLANVGTPLIEQRDVLEEKWRQYQTVYSERKPNWSSIKHVVNQPLTWQQYLSMEEELFARLKNTDTNLDARLLSCSQYLISKMDTPPTGQDAGEPRQLNRLDEILLAYLYKLYYPHKPVKRGDTDFKVSGFIGDFIFNSNKFHFGQRTLSWPQLNNLIWPDTDQEIEQLLYRFVYSRIFGKWYFGGGFGQLSLVTGFNHLIVAYLLIKIRAKASAIVRGADQVSFVDVMESVRMLEESLSGFDLDGNAAGLFELLMFSPRRIERLIRLV